MPGNYVGAIFRHDDGLDHCCDGHHEFDSDVDRRLRDSQTEVTFAAADQRNGFFR
jgi:hypothetical protein